MSIRWVSDSHARSRWRMGQDRDHGVRMGEVQGNIIWHPQLPARKDGKKGKEKQRGRAKGYRVRKAA